MGNGKSNLPFSEIAEAALRQSEALLEEWLPGGKRSESGTEWIALNPTRSDGKPGSFSINLNSGKWGDFATGDGGLDLVSLYAYLFHQGSQGHAAVELADRFGIAVPPLEKGRKSKRKAATVKSAEPKPEAPAVINEPRTWWKPIRPVPIDAAEPPKAHPNRGIPARISAYREADGQLIGFVCRFITSDGGKDDIPLVFAQHEKSGKREWRWMAFSEERRPLYGLDRAAALPDATLLFTEGEKCADVAHLELAELASLTWPGGCNGARKADIEALSDRSVKKAILWPDCDAQREKLTKDEKAAGVEPSSKPYLPIEKQPGMKVMLAIAERLHAIGFKIWIVDIPAPGEKPGGWDIADAVSEGLTGLQLAEHVRQKARLWNPAESISGMPDLPPESIYTPSEAGAGPEDWRRQLLRKDDRLIDSRENVYLILRFHSTWTGVIWRNEFARRIEKRRPAPWDCAATFVPGTEWLNEDDLYLGLWLAQKERLLIRSQETLATAVAWLAAENQFHPVRDYLDALIWDGQGRTSNWLTDYLGVRETEYAVLVGRLFLIGMVARIYQPGCQMRFMPILEGQQFKGKSSALRILGGEWFGDTTLDLSNKDVYQLIQDRWLYEIGELDAFNRAESTRMKAFVSSQVDRFRAPYDRAPRDWLRQTVFVGTTNQDSYFKDHTGNTRYWPVRVEEIDTINLEGLASVRDQLFAEAVSLYMNGERWHPTREEQQRLFEPEQADREIADPWQSLIARWLRSRTSPRVSATEIIIDCLKIEPGKIDSMRQMSTRVGIAMNRIGWIKKRETSGDREYYYVAPEGWNPPAPALNEQGDDDVPL